MTDRIDPSGELMRILILDNDPALLRSLELVLAARGHEIFSFDEPGAFCACAQATEKPPDVLVIDFMLNDVTAVEVLKRIGDRAPGFGRVILISGHTDLVEALDLPTLKIESFLPKPLDLERLVGVIERTCTEPQAKDKPQ